MDATSPGEGCGATFSVSLPLIAAEPGAAPPAEYPLDGPELEFPSLAGLAILVVDDDEDSRELVQLILGHCGASVTTASSSSEALPLVETVRPNAIVSDIALPGEDGFHFIRQVRALADPLRSIPALALTALVRAEDRRQTLAAGFQMHVPKPVEPVALSAAVARLCGVRP